MSWTFETAADLEAAGYTRGSRAVCRGERCGAEIEWWVTPGGKNLALEPASLQPHWAKCPDADRFRGQGRLF